MAERGQRAWLVAIGLAAFAALAFATRFGIGISTDSVAYIAEARQLVDGEGLTLPAGLLEIYADLDASRDPVPTTHFPPLYPLVIAATGLADAAASSLRWLHAVLLAGTAVTLALMVERHTGSRWIGSLAAGTVLLSPSVLRTHGMAWSEPLFVTLGFAGLLALAHYLDDQRPWLLVTGSLALGLAFVTRYAGIAFVLTGLFGFLVRRRPIGLRPAALYLVLALLPMALYLAVMAAKDAEGGGFTIAFGAAAAIELQVGREAVQNWFRPAVWSRPLGLILWLAVAVVLYVQFRRSLTSPRAGAHRQVPLLPLVLAVFVAVYAAVILTSMVVFDEYLPLEERDFVPPFVAGVGLVACGIGRLGGQHGGLREAALLGAATFITATVAAGSELVATGSSRSYPGFEQLSWRQSEAMAQIAGLPPSTRIHSNFPEAIYIRTGREARLLPRERFASGRMPTYREERVARLIDDVHSGRGVVVYFTSSRRDLLPAPGQLESWLGAPPGRYVSDALLYETRPGP